MLNGERFRAELEAAAHDMAMGKRGSLMGEPNAERARLWANLGAEAIDDSDADRAIRFLLAATVNLLEQHMLIMQNIVWKSAGRILVPAWLSAVALLWIALK